MKLKQNFGHIGITQRAVINDFINGLSEHEVLEKHKVSPSRYRRWLNNAVFREAFQDRIDSIKRQQRFIALHSLPDAARRLAELITSEKDETARKACLDIIALQKADAADEAARKAEQEEHEDLEISSAKASRMLAILAEPDEPEAEPESVGAVREPPMSNDELRPNVGADPCVCPPVNASDNCPPPQEPLMSYGEWVERNSVAQPDTTCRVDSSAVHADTPNPEKEAALKRCRDEELLIARVAERRRLLYARPAKGIDLSTHNQNKTFMRRYEL